MTDRGLTTPDPWAHLRRHTPARIALGRAGGSVPTREVLEFAMAHAAARDAVHAEVDWAQLAADLGALGLETVSLNSAARDRQTYLQRPDLGRRLDDASREVLTRRAATGSPGPDLAIVVSDGLSAPAAQIQVSPLLMELLPMLAASRISVSPACLARHGRVAVQDEVGHALDAKVALILLGERPGLGTPDSLGAYVVFGPRAGRTDADRNCVSNIRPGGLGFCAAAGTLHYLITESLRRRISGVTLKDERDALPPPPEQSSHPKAIPLPPEILHDFPVSG
jgi:ethanolamine ammonia-lyase small subunit